MAYWLEFKNDDEFAGHRFGGIGGGQAMKYGLYQRQSDQAWMGGAANAPRVLSLEEAIAKARQQRDELLAGDRVLSGLNDLDPSDDAYARLQAEMSRAAPELSGDAGRINTGSCFTRISLMIFTAHATNVFTC